MQLPAFCKILSDCCEIFEIEIEDLDLPALFLKAGLQRGRPDRRDGTKRKGHHGKSQIGDRTGAGSVEPPATGAS